MKAYELAALSKWVDAGQGDRDPEAITWGRLAKVSEECGEVIEAFIGATGQNPRKGVCRTLDDVRKELLDVAVTALAAHEHMTGNDGSSLEALAAHVSALCDRAEIATEPDGQRLAQWVEAAKTTTPNPFAAAAAVVQGTTE